MCGVVWCVAMGGGDCRCKVRLSKLSKHLQLHVFALFDQYQLRDADQDEHLGLIEGLYQTKSEVFRAILPAYSPCLLRGLWSMWATSSALSKDCITPS